MGFISFLQPTPDPLYIGFNYHYSIQIKMNKSSKHQKEIGGYLFWDNCLLGKGATGNVYRGKRKIDGNLIAVKVINEANVRTQVLSYLLQNEINACLKLTHQNILKTYDVIRENGFSYIISELYSGGSLRDHIRRKGKLTQLESLNLFEAIVRGYAVISKAKIIHRDLKTDNILLTEGGQPVIIDFGFCEFTNSTNKPQTQYNVGSPAYMPPEAYNKNIYSEKSDIWSLGVILHEMVNGNILKMHTKNADKFFRDLEKMKYPNIPLKYQNDIIMHLLLNCLTVNKFQRTTTSDLINMIVQWKNQHQPVEEKKPQIKKRNNSVHEINYIPLTEIKKLQPKDESNYATQNAESPLRKVIKPKEKQFTKLKKRAMNNESNQTFCIKPMQIQPLALGYQLGNKPEHSPNDTLSTQNSPVKVADSPGISPSFTPKLPKFCRKNETASTHNLRLKLRMI